MKLCLFERTLKFNVENTNTNVFMNEHLAAMVEKRITTKKGLMEIEGVGEARVEKYGDAVLAILKEEFSKLGEKNETGNPSIPFDTDA